MSNSGNPTIKSAVTGGTSFCPPTCCEVAARIRQTTIKPSSLLPASPRNVFGIKGDSPKLEAIKASSEAPKNKLINPAVGQIAGER